jgi:ribonuclease HI
VPEVKPLTYFDGFGSTNIRASNNVAELLAATAATEIAADQPIKKLLIKTDSEYVRRGIQKWMPQWIKNRNLQNQDGEIPNASHWKTLLSNINVLTKKGIEFDVMWVKGHTDVQGNIKADYLAKIGRVNSEVKFNIAPVSKEHEKFRTEVIKNPPEGYWKTVTDRNPMLHHTWMYFNTRATSQVRGEYYTATRGEDEDFPGKMESDAAYAVIKLSKPVEVLEQLRKYQTEITGDHDSVIVANLVNLFTKDRANDLETFGAATLVRHHPRKADLTFIDKTPITQEKNPPLLALRVIEATSDLKARLIDFESGNLAGYTVTDITEHFYKETEKKKAGVSVMALRDTISTSDKSIKLEVESPFGKQKVTLNFSLDIPSRNCLKKLESMEPEIKILSWKDSEQCFRWVSVVKTNDGSIGIWSAYYANLRFVSVLS